MKKVSKALALFLAAGLIFSGCQGKKTSKVEEEPPKEEVQEKTQEIVYPEDPEVANFFARYVETCTRPIAVMIDNDNDQARPQAGIEDAFLIYELVVEGGATRLMALFKNVETEKIGPTRSSRHYFLDYVMENDAIYTHFGWSPKAQQDIASLKINNINGILASDDDIFWRERKFKNDWHSAYTSIAKIKELADKKYYSPETGKTCGLEYAREFLNMKTDTVANNVNLRYAGHYRTGYVYNAETKLYEKTINGKPHVTQSGETVKLKNVIIQFIEDTALGDGSARRNIKTTGEGKGYYITEGYCQPITWAKAARDAETKFTGEDGKPLMVNAGKTIINVISPKANVTIE